MELAKRVGFVLVLGVLGVGCDDDEVSTALVQRPDASTLALDGHAGDVATEVADDTNATATDVATETTTATDTAADVTDDAATSDDVPVDVTDDVAADVSDVTLDVGPVSCTKPEDCPAPPACQRATCLGELCGTAPANEGACQDGDPCTLDDRCVSGTCTGKPKACDDQNPCTADACADGQCTFTPIPDCAVDTQCVGKEAGTACDDGQASTSADLCLDGECRGFVTTRVAADDVDELVDLSIDEIDHGPDGWSAIFSAVDGDGQHGHLLARVTAPASPVAYPATLQGMPFHGLYNGLVTDEEGYLWQFLNGGWTYDNPWDDAVWLTGRGYGRGLWSMQDTRASSDTRRVWVVGDDGIDEWIRYCHDESGEVECFEQELDDFDPSSLPVAIAGVPACDQSGCQRARLALAADAWSDGEAFNDTFDNADGEDGTWDKGAVPGSPAARHSRAIAGWGDASQAQFLAVGTSGYLVHRRAGGSWSQPLALKEAQSTRTFTGVVASGGLVAVVAHRSAGGGQRAFELWTAPARKDVEVAANWTVHALLVAPAADGAGPLDVDVAQGEVRIVGAIARVVEGDVVGLDGLVLVRAP